MINTNSRLYHILTDIRTWKIMGVIAIILTVLDIVVYGAFITCESLRNENDTSFTGFNSIPENLYLAHHENNIRKVQQGIKVENAKIMNNSYDKDGVEHIGYNPQTAKFNVEFSKRPNQSQRVYAQKLTTKFNHLHD